MPRSRPKKPNVRLSVTLVAAEYAELTRLGVELDLSAAWMIRRAVSEFVPQHREGVLPRTFSCGDLNRNRLGSRRREESVVLPAGDEPRPQGVIHNARPLRITAMAIRGRARSELVGWRRVMTDTPQVLLAHHLKTLKLPTFLREYDKLARQCATEGAGHVRYLVRLTELELIDRERRMVERRIRQARFPAVKSLDSFDFKAIASLNKMLVLELARCEYVERRENIIALGNSGTGKTHIALGLGLAACQKGLSVGFLTAAALVHELMEARDEKRLLRLQKQLAK